MVIRVPFNRPFASGSELALIGQAIGHGHLSGDGAFTRRCSELLEGLLGAPRVLLTTSCTHALEMAALLLDLQPGDEVIVPDFTFVSTPNAFALRGARIVFADIRPDTLNLDEGQLERLLTPRTKAIVPVHYAGIGCEMDAIMKVAEQHKVEVVEDNAHGLFGRYKGRYLGTFGAMATQSFHETKNISCGEGGALVINAPRFVERAEIIREKGTDRSRFFRGQVDKYTWVDIGSSYLISDILAAYLAAQLENWQMIQSRRGHVWASYHERLATWAARSGVRRPHVPEYCENPYHMYYLIMPSGEARDALIAHLKERGILAVFHYLPLHASRMGHKHNTDGARFPVSTSISERLVRLPLFAGMTSADIDAVTDAVLAFAVPRASSAR